MLTQKESHEKTRQQQWVVQKILKQRTNRKPVVYLVQYLQKG